MSPPIRVLLVCGPTEDGDTASSVLRGDASGFAVTTVGTVDEVSASLMADRDTVDCVVCDRSVSEAEGFDVLELVRE